MGRRPKRIRPDKIEHDTIDEVFVKMDEVSPSEYRKTSPGAGYIYARLDKHARAYKYTFAEQYRDRLVSKLGNIRVGDLEFELGKTYEVEVTPEIEGALRARLLIGGSKFHYIGDKPMVRA